MKKIINQTSSPFQRIYKVVSKIPRGKVSTYKLVSLMANVSNPKIVGYALHSNQHPKDIPCHRVIKHNGSLADGYAFGGKENQKKLLKNEGIRFIDKYTVDLKNHLENFLYSGSLISSVTPPSSIKA